MAVEMGTRHQIFRVMDEDQYNKLLVKIKRAYSLNGAYDAREVAEQEELLNSVLEELRSTMPYRGNEIFTT